MVMFAGQRSELMVKYSSREIQGKLPYFLEEYKTKTPFLLSSKLCNLSNIPIYLTKRFTSKNFLPQYSYFCRYPYDASQDEVSPGRCVPLGMNNPPPIFFSPNGRRVPDFLGDVLSVFKMPILNMKKIVYDGIQYNS
jgi:hypothetical protein